MNTNDFLAANPDISEEQIKEQEIFETPEPLADKALSDSRALDCGLVWVRDQGRYAVLRATITTCVTVSTIRNGTITTRQSFTIFGGQELSLLRNDDGRNYDGYVCC